MFALQTAKMWRIKSAILVWVLLVSPGHAEISWIKGFYLDLKDCADTLEESRQLIQEQRAIIQNLTQTTENQVGCFSILKEPQLHVSEGERLVLWADWMFPSIIFLSHKHTHMHTTETHMNSVGFFECLSLEKQNFLVFRNRA